MQSYEHFIYFTIDKGEIVKQGIIKSYKNYKCYRQSLITPIAPITLITKKVAQNGQPFFLRIKLLIVQAIDVYLALERFVERHIGLCARHALHVQNLVEDGAHKVFVINAVEFYHQVVRAGDVVTLHNLGNLLQALYCILLLRDIAHADRDKGAHVKTESFRRYNKAAALNHTHILQLLDTLMNSRTRDTALARNLKERRAGILNQITKDFSIRSV